MQQRVMARTIRPRHTRSAIAMPTIAPVESGFPFTVAVIPPRTGVWMGVCVADENADEDELEIGILVLVVEGAILDDTDEPSARN
jgi:hypothetical protein